MYVRSLGGAGEWLPHHSTLWAGARWTGQTWSPRGRVGEERCAWKGPPAISVSVNVKNVRHLVPREAFKRGFAYSSTDAFFSCFFLAHGEGKTKVTFTAACARGVEFYVQPQLIFQLD